MLAYKVSLCCTLSETKGKTGCAQRIVHSLSKEQLCDGTLVKRLSSIGRAAHPFRPSWYGEMGLEGDEGKVCKAPQGNIKYRGSVLSAGAWEWQLAEVSDVV